jgi:hypothetical protein
MYVAALTVVALGLTAIPVIRFVKGDMREVEDFSIALVGLLL